MLKRALHASGTFALSQLSQRLAAFASSPLGKVVAAWTAKEEVAGGNDSISGDRIVSAFLSQQDQKMNDVIEVYNEMLASYKSAKVPGSSWPIICIDEANVLTRGREGSQEDKGALEALLRFFVKVSVNCAELTNEQA